MSRSIAFNRARAPNRASRSNSEWTINASRRTSTARQQPSVLRLQPTSGEPDESSRSQLFRSTLTRTLAQPEKGQPLSVRIFLKPAFY